MPELSIGTPFDDVFRTLVIECSPLVIPILNEAFGEKYTGKEEIIFFPNEHFLRQQDGQEQKRITDSSFMVIGETEKRYLFECQSTADNSMLIRIFEYATQIALDEGNLENNQLDVTFPNAAILFLRSTKNTPDVMKINFHFPEDEARMDVPCLKVKNYTIDEIFEKQLFFLIPFYIFTYESRFKEIDKDEDQLTQLKEEYAIICRRLEKALEEGLMTVFTYKTILEMSEKVVEALAEKHRKIKEGVRSIMGGCVIEHEAKRILDQGRMEGISIGRNEGISIGRNEGISIGEKRGISIGEQRAEKKYASQIAALKAELAKYQAAQNRLVNG